MIIKNLEIDSVGLEEYASVPLDGAEHVNRIGQPHQLARKRRAGLRNGHGAVFFRDVCT